MSDTCNLFLDPISQNSLLSFRQRPYIWDSDQTSESKALRDQMLQRYQLGPTRKTRSYVPDILDHSIEGSKAAHSPTLTKLHPPRWQANVLGWLGIFFLLFIWCLGYSTLRTLFGEPVAVVLKLLAGRFCVVKCRDFLNSEDEVPPERREEALLGLQDL